MKRLYLSYTRRRQNLHIAPKITKSAKVPTQVLGETEQVGEGLRKLHLTKVGIKPRNNIRFVV